MLFVALIMLNYCNHFSVFASQILFLWSNKYVESNEPCRPMTQFIPEEIFNFGKISFSRS